MEGRGCVNVGMWRCGTMSSYLDESGETWEQSESGTGLVAVPVVDIYLTRISSE